MNKVDKSHPLGVRELKRWLLLGEGAEVLSHPLGVRELKLNARTCLGIMNGRTL